MADLMALGQKKYHQLRERSPAKSRSHLKCTIMANRGVDGVPGVLSSPDKRCLRLWGAALGLKASSSEFLGLDQEKKNLKKKKEAGRKI